MSRENLLRINSKKCRKEEIIDDVRVVHTGVYYIHPFPQFSTRMSKYRRKEILKMYDATNGNFFYSNCFSIEEANRLIQQLQEEGKEAVIGPKAPWRSYITGEPIKNTDENSVGVYLVNKKRT